MSKNLEERDWNIIERWLEDSSFINWARRSNDEDVDKWENHLNYHTDKWELAKIARSLIQGIPFKKINHQNELRQKDLQALLKNIDLRHRSKSNAVSKPVYKRFYIPAAAIAFLLLSAAVYWQFFFNPQIMLVTSYGEQLETILPDGSVVILNANSKLSYPKLNCRKVRLEGEAYFEIAKKPDTGAKFQVFTKDLSVTVLGTSFNVNTRDDQTKVFLEQGKITLAVSDSKSDEIEMEPGDFISYSRKNKQLEKKINDTSALEAASWKEGALIFKDTPLMEALFKIEDIYGIQFIIQTDDVKKEKISGGVPIKDLEVTLSTLSEVYGLQMDAVGKRYFISGMN